MCSDHNGNKLEIGKKNRWENHQMFRNWYISK